MPGSSEAGKIWLINFACTGDIAFWRDKFVSFELILRGLTAKSSQI
ncbi:MAG: hypothetical protein ACFNUU_01920 [Campylobacter sp.]